MFFLQKEKKIVVPFILLLIICSVYLLTVHRLTYASTERDVVEMHPTKDETIYGKLNHDGEVKSVYVVNHFHIQQDGRYVDYGVYSTVENLTNSFRPKIMDDAIHWDLKKSNQGFYYKGELSTNELPWNIDISYYLNGKKTQANQLAGARGLINININFEPLDDGENYFIDNYLAQIQIPINQRNTKIISATGASKMVLGETVTLAYTVLPKDSISIELALESTDFSLSEIDFIMSPFTLGESLNGEEFSQGFNSLNSGMDEVVNGSVLIQQGMFDLNTGLNQLNHGQKELVTNGNNILFGMKTYNASLSELNLGMLEIVYGSNEIKGVLDQLAAEGQKLAMGYSQITEMGAELKLTQELLKQVLAEIEAPELIENLNHKLLVLESMSNGIEMLNQSLNEYTNAVSMLAEEHHSFHSHIESMPKATNELSIGFDSLLTGNKYLMQGAASIGAGLEQANLNTTKLPIAMGRLIEGQRQIQAGICDAEKSLIERLGLTDKDNETISFTSPKNISIQSVQFVLRTPAINTPSKALEEAFEEPKKGFIAKLVELFRR